MTRILQLRFSSGAGLLLALVGLVGSSGFVALSPLLHRLIEHGGIGPAHVHFSGSGRHAVSADLAGCADIGSPARPEGVRPDGDVPLPADSSGDHEHRSLPQLLAGGLVEPAGFDLPVWHPPSSGSRLVRDPVPASFQRDLPIPRLPRPPPFRV